MPKRRMCALAIVLAMPSGSVFADWQYVEWGMTPTQVVAASKGEARLTTGADKNLVCAYKDQTPVAYIVGKRIDTFTFDVVICADASKRVSSVALEPTPYADSYYKLRAALTGRYGQPIEDGKGDIATTTWRDVAGGNLVRLDRVISGGRVEYRTLKSGL